ncbi:MAG TPA: hypothetical protein VFR24_11450 [Candidatus Angelobacter sp.]|nr:hypothetical protein [Candidatus Angelobacter sp.]
MLTFVFWNVNRKPLAELAGELAWSAKADFVILAEPGFGFVELNAKLNAQVADYKYHKIRPARLMFFSKFDGLHRPLLESDYFSMIHCRLPGRPDFLLVVAHLSSKLYSSAESQSFECQHMAQQIRVVEERLKHRRTILIGDLNSNPFEPGLIGATALHGVMSRQIAQRLGRRVKGEEYPFFYNPMWNHFGDESGSPGTYFYFRSEHVNYYWNMFDQALIRPELLRFLPPKGVEIVQSINSKSLLSKNGQPDTNSSSDHLPIKLTLEM